MQAIGRIIPVVKVRRTKHASISCLWAQLRLTAELSKEGSDQQGNLGNSITRVGALELAERGYL